jgi:hypothetical protein
VVGLRGKVLDFAQRLEIAIDVAHGLTYLQLYAGKHFYFSPNFYNICKCTLRIMYFPFLFHLYHVFA